MKQRVNLAFIGTYPEVSKTFLDITAEMKNIRAVSVDVSFEKAAEKAVELEPGLDAILSRGETAQYIRDAADIPVIYIPITPFDVAKAIHTLPEDVGEAAVIYYHENVLNLQEIASMYKIRLDEYFFTDYKSIERDVLDAHRKGVILKNDKVCQMY